MRNLYLIRHGMPDFEDGIKLCIGRTEIDIGDIGTEEALKLKLFFRDKQIEHIFASPLTRCVHTAEIIAEGIREEGIQDIRIHEGLSEIYMGCWEGIPLKDIKKSLGEEPDDGEKRIDALDRFEKALIDIMSKTSGNVICVAHAGVNCAFIAKVTGKDIRTSRALKQPYGCYNQFEFDGEKFMAVATGCIP